MVLLINNRLLPHNLTFKPWQDHLNSLRSIQRTAIDQLQSQLANARYPFTPGWREKEMDSSKSIILSHILFDY